MAKKVYIGVNSKARRVKKIYIGVGNVAKKVKKGYIGVAGIARLFFKSGELEYFANKISFDFLEGTATSDYMVLADWTTAKGYNKSLTSTNLTAPTSRTVMYSDRRPYCEFGAASTGEYNLLVGGYNSEMSSEEDRYLKDVDCYDGSLTKVSATSLTYGCAHKAGVSVGNYALFGGGYMHGSNIGCEDVVAYDTSLTQTYAQDMYQTISPGTSWNYNYAFFLGGRQADNNYQYWTFEKIGAAYDSSLTKTSIELDDWYGFGDKRHCRAGQYALFAPGDLYDGQRPPAYDTTRVVAFDGSLTKHTPSVLPSPGYPDGMATADEYGIISSSDYNGYNSGSYTYGINVYDEHLVRTVPFQNTGGYADKGVSFDNIAILRHPFTTYSDEYLA